MPLENFGTSFAVVAMISVSSPSGKNKDIAGFIALNAVPAVILNGVRGNFEEQVKDALKIFANTQGIIAAPESGHAISEAVEYALDNDYRYMVASVMNVALTHQSVIGQVFYKYIVCMWICNNNYLIILYP